MAADVVAELTGARLAFGDRVLWDHLDLTVRAGEFIAVLGPNGTGKTSLLKVLLGQLPLTAGTATVAGGPSKRAASGSAMSPSTARSTAGCRCAAATSSASGTTVTDGASTRLRDRSAKRDAVQRALDQVNGDAPGAACRSA